MSKLKFTISLRAVSVFLLLLFSSQGSYAIPSFARQMGVSCAACHTNAFGPALNSIGRQFKESGYTLGDSNKFPPLSVMLVAPSFTHANKDVPGPSSPFEKNNNVTADELGLFYGGKFFTSDLVNAGGFIQATYEPLADAIAWDNVDIKLTHDFLLPYGQSKNTNSAENHAVTFGISLNNSPTAQDPWNTTPTWGFPYVGSPVEDLPGPPGDATPMISNLGQTVGGATAYAVVNDVIPNSGWNAYVEGGAYASLSPGFQRTMGVLGSDTADELDGGAPYWRLAIERQSPHTYMEMGHYGFIANIFPGRDHTAGTDRYTDLAIDGTFEYFPADENTHNFQLWGTVIWEDQKLNASQALGNTANRNSSLTTYNITGSYTYKQTYQVNLGYFASSGSTDPVLWSNPSGNPDSDGLIMELDYTPFGKDDSLYAPYLNVRLALQYVAFFNYLGRSSNYDGTGRNASDNNTLLLNAWFAF